jgi:DNA repair ATPase RecN
MDDKIKQFKLFVKLREQDYTDIAECISKLQDMTEQYRNCYDLNALETLKREFNSYLQRLTTLYPLTKKYKGSNHTYLEDAIKKLKAETTDLLLHSGKNVTQSEKLLYDHPLYKEQKKTIDTIIGLFIKVEVLHENFNTTLQSIVQSISVLSKEYGNSKSIN